jgi:hypothetical protein
VAGYENKEGAQGLSAGIADCVRDSNEWSLRSCSEDAIRDAMAPGLSVSTRQLYCYT